MRITNKSDETIRLEPGETVDVMEASTIRKSQYGKLMELIVEGV